MNKPIALMAAAALMLVAGCSDPSRPEWANHVCENKDAAAHYIKHMLGLAGSPAILSGNSVFVERDFTGHTYWLAKGIFNNWTVAGQNQGSKVMGVVLCSPDDNNFFRFLTEDDFKVFEQTGDRTLLHMPDLSIEGCKTN